MKIFSITGKLASRVRQGGITSCVAIYVLLFSLGTFCICSRANGQVLVGDGASAVSIHSNEVNASELLEGFGLLNLVFEGSSLLPATTPSGESHTFSPSAIIGILWDKNITDNIRIVKHLKKYHLASAPEKYYDHDKPNSESWYIKNALLGVSKEDVKAIDTTEYDWTSTSQADGVYYDYRSLDPLQIVMPSGKHDLTIRMYYYYWWDWFIYVERDFTCIIESRCSTNVHAAANKIIHKNNILKRDKVGQEIECSVESPSCSAGEAAISTDSVINQLQELNSLLRQGAISDSEYEELKSKVLEGGRN